MSSRANRMMVGSRTHRVLSICLRGYLALFLTGCAGTRPAPPTTVGEAREMETRTIEADCDQAFEAVITGLQDLGFSVESAGRDGGLIVASRESEAELAAISKDAAPGKKGGLPTWAKVALVATGVIVVVVVVAALADDDDDSSGQRDERDHHARHHDHDSGDTEVVVVDDHSAPSGPPIYKYRITVNLRAKSDTETIVRVSAQGTMSRCGSVAQAGPVHDPAFFSRFFSYVSGSITVPMESAR
jgi:hypothetical protein